MVDVNSGSNGVPAITVVGGNSVGFSDSTSQSKVK